MYHITGLFQRPYKSYLLLNGLVRSTLKYDRIKIRVTYTRDERGDMESFEKKEENYQTKSIRYFAAIYLIRFNSSSDGVCNEIDY